ncbi:capsule assembly Wzi family protein [Spirosoma gilvum]
MFNPVANVGSTHPFLLPEAHLKLAIGSIELYAGRRRDVIGLGDSLLSSGFIIGSGNALPIPKIQIATRGYVPLKFLKNFVSINAGYAHGWFTDAYIQGSYLHQKYLYWRFGKPTASLKVHIGMNHQVQWGGQADYLLNSPYAEQGRLPSSFKYYGNVVMASRPTDYENQDYTSFDGSYRIGNHVGGHDFGVELTTYHASILIYYQHPFEDVSGLLFQNLPDGLFGFRWKRPSPAHLTGLQVNHVVAEFLTTLYQSGATFWRINSSYQGKDNYFNHSQYQQGWSYQGRSIGTPFIATALELKSDISQAAPTFFADNRVQVYYIGMSGQFSKCTKWTTRLAYSRHYGTYDFPFITPLNQTSFLATALMPVSKGNRAFLYTSIAFDTGQVYAQTVGLSLCFLYKFI